MSGDDSLSELEEAAHSDITPVPLLWPHAARQSTGPSGGVRLTSPLELCLSLPPRPGETSPQHPGTGLHINISFDSVQIYVLRESMVSRRHGDGVPVSYATREAS